MKKIVWALIMVIISGGAIAQGAKVTSAGNYLRQGEFKKAKLAIDAAAIHPKTEGTPKMLVYKGKIYYQLAIDTTAELVNERKDAIFVSANAFEAAVKAADSRTDLGEIEKYLAIYVYNKVFDDARLYFNSKDYANAQKYFAKCGEIKDLYLSTEKYGFDTVAYYYAGVSASAQKNGTEAISFYDKVKNTGYKDGIVYTRIANEYKTMGDTAKAMEVLGEGRAQYPDNQAMLIAEFNLYVEAGETAKAISNIDKAITGEPENPAYYYVRGKLRESAETPDLVGAEADYMKTLALDSNHLDANHDMGALYVNQSIVVVDEMNNLPLSATKEYNAKKKELDGIYGKALPFLKKAYELDPNDKEVQDILMKLYLRNSDMDNYNKLKGEIDTAK